MENFIKTEAAPQGGKYHTIIRRGDEVLEGDSNLIIYIIESSRKASSELLADDVNV